MTVFGRSSFPSPPTSRTAPSAPPSPPTTSSARFFPPSLSSRSSLPPHQIIPHAEASREHIDAIFALPNIDVEQIRAKKFKVCLDTVNGAGGPIMMQLLQRLGCEVPSPPSSLFSFDSSLRWQCFCLLFSLPPGGSSQHCPQRSFCPRARAPPSEPRRPPSRRQGPPLSPESLLSLSN